MKKVLIKISLIILMISMNFIAAYAQYDSIYVASRCRTFLTHLPPQYDAGQDTLYSLIIAMHGGFGNAYNLEEQSQLSQKADTAANPFIVVYPEGVKSPLGVRTWNAGACCGYARDNNIDDVGFISALIDTLLNRYLIDEKRVYATGMSNGGMMSYRLAAELTCKIAATAPVASTMTLEGTWTPTRPMPIIHFHSYLDENVPYYGGVGSGVSNHYNPPVDSVLNVWSGLNGCANQNDTLYHEVDEYLFKVWTQCNNNADIHCYVTYDGGHSWPGGKKGSDLGDPPSKKINADDLMWAFFLDHPANGGTSIISGKSKSLKNFILFQNYPNPFNPQTSISYQLPAACNMELALYNTLGQKVRTLIKKRQKAGIYEITFNAGELSSGIYFYKLKTGEVVLTRKFILLQ